MVGTAVAFLLVLIFPGVLDPQAQLTEATDADVWTAALEQLREGQSELLVANETMPTVEFHTLGDSPRQARLLDLLRQRNNSTQKPITGVRLPPNTRLVAASSVQPWEDLQKKFPGARFMKVSLPAYSEAGTTAIIYYSSTGGFDDSRGGYVIFEQKQGHWTIVDAVGLWIT